MNALNKTEHSIEEECSIAILVRMAAVQEIENKLDKEKEDREKFKKTRGAM